MTTLRLALVALVLLVGPAPAAEKWADDKLPVTNDLELWLDAAKLSAAHGKALEPGQNSTGGRTRPATADT